MLKELKAYLNTIPRLAKYWSRSHWSMDLAIRMALDSIKVLLWDAMLAIIQAGRTKMGPAPAGVFESIGSER